MAKLTHLVVALCVFELIAVTYQLNQTEVNYFTGKFEDVLKSSKSSDGILEGMQQMCGAEVKQCAQNALAKLDPNTQNAGSVSQEIVPALTNFACAYPPDCLKKNVTCLVKGQNLPKCYVHTMATNLATSLSYSCDLIREAVKAANSDK